jgi:hypothetical protein
MELFVALLLVLFGATFASDIEGSELLGSVGAWLINLLESLALAFLLVFFYLFLTGRFVPRWTLLGSLVNTHHGFIAGRHPLCKRLCN